MTAKPQVFMQLMGKVSTLERRADHLQRQLGDWRTSSGAQSYVAAERAALESAIACMKLKYAELEGMGHPLEILRKLVAFMDRDGEAVGNSDEERAKLTELLERASIALTEFDAAVQAQQEGKNPHEDSERLRTAR